MPGTSPACPGSVSRNIDAERTAGAGIARQWAYPYAIEHAGKLLVVYASTKENAELSIVEVGVLEGVRE